MGRWKYALLAVLLLLFAGGGWVGYSVHRFLHVTMPNAYGLWYVGSLIVEHLRDKQGRWPRGWEDVRPYWDKTDGTSSRPLMTFEELQELIDVDWARLPTAFAEGAPIPAEPRHLNVIRRRDGGDGHWASAEPHEIILIHLGRLKVAP